MGQNHFRARSNRGLRRRPDVRGIAYTTPAHLLLAEQGPDSRLARAIGRDQKGKISMLLYAVGIALSFVNHWVAYAIYVAVALMWLVPDRRIERPSHGART